MELKKQGWAIVPLVEGSLPVEPTGDTVIDQFIYCLSREGTSKAWPSNTDNPRAAPSQSDLKRGMLRYNGLDLSHALWETASILLRRYSIDFSSSDIVPFVQEVASTTVSLVEVMKKIQSSLGLRHQKIAFMGFNTHRLPHAAIRLYCQSRGHSERFFCVQSINAYENYFGNFRSNISTKMALRNVTAYPHQRVAFLPEPNHFERWYLDNSRHHKQMLSAAMTIIRMRRASSVAASAPGAIRKKLFAWKEEGGTVACMFGKVVCDLGVPYDGGPAHANLKDWLNHTTKLVNGSRTLLLVKPHPHEVNNKIGMFLTESFTDLLDGTPSENVIILGHSDFNIEELVGLIDFGLLWNGTAAVELGVLGIPAVLCSHFAPLDYPVGHMVPSDRVDYEKIVLGMTQVSVASDLRERSAAWLHFLDTEDVSIPYRYHSRPLTNQHVFPATWFDEEVKRYLDIGDPNVERLALRVTGDLAAAHHCQPTRPGISSASISRS